MNQGRRYIAVVKCYEARDNLRTARAAVETLSRLAVVPGLQPQLEALLAALEGHSSALEDYTKKLIEGNR